MHVLVGVRDMKVWLLWLLSLERIVPLTYERWREDGLKKDQNMLP